jgi:hypothetical protein
MRITRRLGTDTPIATSSSGYRNPILTFRDRGIEVNRNSDYVQERQGDRDTGSHGSLLPARPRKVRISCARARASRTLVGTMQLRGRSDGAGHDLRKRDN